MSLQDISINDIHFLVNILNNMYTNNNIEIQNLQSQNHLILTTINTIINRNYNYIQSSTPRGRPTAPRGRPTAPRGQSAAPRGQPVAPRGQPVAPRGQPAAPIGQPAAPRGQPAISRPQQTQTRYPFAQSVNSNSEIGRIMINNTPYIIESIEHIQIPLTENNYNNLYNTSFIDSFNDLLMNDESFLDPIEIYPTQRQIENATRIVTYSDILSPNNTSCPISLESFNNNDQVIIICHCQHIFNISEFNSWFRTNCRCPVCRYDIREYNVNNNIQNLNEERISNSIDISNNSNQNFYDELLIDFLNNTSNYLSRNINSINNTINSNNNLLNQQNRNVSSEILTDISSNIIS